jgi:hypothetical protein
MIGVGLGCDGHEITHTEEKEFVRIFMHNPGKYTVLVKEQNELKSFEPAYRIKQTLIADVPPGKPMYYKLNYSGGDGKHRSQESIEYHIHSEKDIDAGSHSNGKTRSQSNVVE